MSNSPSGDRARLIRDSLARQLEHANRQLPGHAQNHESHIRSIPSSSFLRSSEGEIQRAATNEALGSTVTEIFSSTESAEFDQPNVVFSGDATLRQSLTTLVSDIIARGRRITDGENIFLKILKLLWNMTMKQR